MNCPEMFAIGSPKWPGLSKLTEEAGEAIQVIGKLMATGGETSHWDGSGDLRDRLIEETGDTLAACLFVAKKNGFEEQLFTRAYAKLSLFNKWHREEQLTSEQNKSTVQNS